MVETAKRAWPTATYPVVLYVAAVNQPRVCHAPDLPLPARLQLSAIIIHSPPLDNLSKRGAAKEGRCPGPTVSRWLGDARDRRA